MTNIAASNDTTTYTPDHDADIIDFAAALESAGRQVAEVRPAILLPSGDRLEIPDELLDALLKVAAALAEGKGVTIAPMDAMLTTQQAADFLGVSRPTLVTMLERGDIPMEKPGRHRKVRLADLLKYQDELRTQRRAALERMVRDAEADDLYAKTDGPPPRTR